MKKTTSNTSIDQVQVEDPTSSNDPTHKAKQISDLSNVLESTQLSTNQTPNDKSESEPTTASTHKRKLIDLCNDDDPIIESDVPEPEGKEKIISFSFRFLSFFAFPLSFYFFIVINMLISTMIILEITN